MGSSGVLNPSRSSVVTLGPPPINTPLHVFYMHMNCNKLDVKLANTFDFKYVKFCSLKRHFLRINVAYDYLMFT